MMKPSTWPFTIATAIACLPLGACRDHPEETVVSDGKATSAEVAVSAGPASDQDEQTPSPAQASTQQEVADLKREMERSEQVIRDMEAAVVMERAKLADDPDYDRSFLNEVLHEQEQERLEIEKARKRIAALTGAGEDAE